MALIHYPFEYESKFRKFQNGNLKVDSGLPISKRSNGKLRQFRNNTRLFIGKIFFSFFYSTVFDNLYFILGGMPNIRSNTINKYNSGITGCISEVQILGSELQLNLEPSVLETKTSADIS